MENFNSSWLVNCTDEYWYYNCSGEKVWKDIKYYGECYDKEYSLPFLIIALLGGLVILCLSLTVLSERTRAQSGLWYTYHLNFVFVVGTLMAFRGFFTNASKSNIYNALFEVMNLLVALTIILINVEVLFTVIYRLLVFVRTTKTRFYCFLGLSWGIGLIWELTFILFGISACEYHWKHFVMDVVRVWIAGVCVLVLVILNTVGYIRYRRTPSILYDQSSPDTSETDSYTDVNVKEWFIYVMIVDAMFIILIIMGEFLLANFEPMVPQFFIGLTCLALAPVRITIRNFIQRIVCCKKDNSHENEIAQMPLEREDSI